ncbi:MAG: methyltransferase domain-containing protein [Cyanothece sp. SIO1E1]|nr:methyltransferase domain-containing protein [Cyanothece sp. SIO1E1]
MDSGLSAAYWNQRYRDSNTPWDIGYVSPPLQHFFDQIQDKSLRILIPGAGRAYEALYLHQQGFDQVWVCDWAKESFTYLRKQAPDFPEERLLIGDFFELALEVDLVVEQTFFCALPRERRADYVRKMAQLLSDNGKLMGLLFAAEFPHAGPPFGGSEAEYRELLHTHFEIDQMTLAPDSIKPRLGRELFFVATKKD